MERTKAWNNSGLIAKWLAIIMFGSLARVALAMRGYNYDVESYRIVADILASGGNVYQLTHRYNYGPIWFLILGLLDHIPLDVGSPLVSLRWKVVVLLTVVDVGIACVLFRRFGLLAAALFFLNPVSIVVTGYNNQFDNVAIFLGLLAVVVMEKSAPLGRDWWLALLLIGVSLVMKHLLFLFPLWIALRQPRWREKILALAVPIVVFFVAFIPYVSEGWNGILSNVLLYRSVPNAPFWTGMMPSVIFRAIPPLLSFLVALTVLGLVCRKHGLIEAYLIYLIGLVIFSPAIVNQYLAISSAAIAVAPNAAYLLYTVGAVAYMAAGDPSIEFWIKPIFGSGGASTGLGYQRLVAFLAMGLFWQLITSKSRAAILHRLKLAGSTLSREIRLQVRAPW